MADESRDDVDPIWDDIATAATVDDLKKVLRRYVHKKNNDETVYLNRIGSLEKDLLYVQNQVRDQTLYGKIVLGAGALFSVPLLGWILTHLGWKG